MASLAEKRLFLLDMDGTLYLDDFLFDKVPEFLSLIRRQGGRYLFLTNNSSRGVEGYIDKMRRLGIETTPEDYLTSADAAQHTLLTEFPGAEVLRLRHSIAEGPAGRGWRSHHGRPVRRYRCAPQRV